MQITPFLAHYQSVYANFYFSSFSRISCLVKAAVLRSKRAAFAMPKRNYRFLVDLSLQNGSCFYALVQSL
ncbi:hypothetical protein CTM55_10055 [Prevotella intermedia]|nr:hypothetical protein CTM55_10055 [Prevotella intermedia]